MHLRLGSTRLHPGIVALRISVSHWLQRGGKTDNYGIMTRYPLFHIVFHGNIDDTLCIKVDEFHHCGIKKMTLRRKNYEILLKLLDKTCCDVLKSFQPANFAVESTAMPNM